ncbi:hypothetical protein A6R68_00283 [Neotoma lepida]|uniref:Ig-like domain-containing protein n=1 Tax=Neotoma lepida TaxID=56216 RepID=A0A1A6GYU8_NEOLE|nr:hypothetical protein A6R68_00283 [Neotoma lepida]
MASHQEEHYHAQAYKSPGPSYMQSSAWLWVWEGPLPPAAPGIKPSKHEAFAQVVHSWPVENPEAKDENWTRLPKGEGARNDVPPYFKTEPVRTQVHLEGNRLVLTCMAEGSWPLEFKWLHNNRELTRFSLEYRQVVPPPQSARS